MEQRKFDRIMLQIHRGDDIPDPEPREVKKKIYDLKAKCRARERGIGSADDQ